MGSSVELGLECLDCGALRSAHAKKQSMLRLLLFIASIPVGFFGFALLALSGYSFIGFLLCAPGFVLFIAACVLGPELPPSLCMECGSPRAKRVGIRRVGDG
jgi:hypothetical protein